MTAQPPVQPDYPSGSPASQPAQGNPASQPIPAPPGDPAAVGASPSPAAPTASGWHQATSTHAGRWVLAIAAGVLAVLMLLGVGVVGLLVLRNHDRFGLVSQRQSAFPRAPLGQGNGRGPGGDNGHLRGIPGAPGTRGGGAQGPGGLGGLLGGSALHGDVTAAVNGSVQTLVFQRGQVTAVSATSITLKSSDGFTGTYGRTPATNSMLAAPVTGGQALVLAQASDKVALRIISTSANGGVGGTS